MLLATALAAGVSVMPARPANAANFFEQLFGASSQERHYGERYNQRGPSYGYGQRRYGDGYYPPAPEAQYAPNARYAPAPKPLPKVTGPKYYTYRPDELKLVSFDNLTDPVTTGSLSKNGLPGLSIDPFDEARHYLSDVKLRALPEVAAAVKAHYSADPEFIWVSGSSINGKAKSVLDVLADAASVGLEPDDYKVTIPDDAFDLSDMADRQRALMQFEMDLSAAALTYTLDATRGRVDPNRISGYHDLPRKKVDLEAALAQMEKADDAGTWLVQQNPQGEQFQELKAELARLKAADAAAPSVEIADGTFVRPGESSPEIANIVAAIQQRASDTLKSDFETTFLSYDKSDSYSPDLVSLVKAFQKENGLSADGVIGSNTIAAMTGFSNADKINQVVLSMERARWLPGVLPAQRVFINEPAFEVYYVADNEQKLKTRVVVGQKNHQTYFFSDQIETVEFNPYWGVPQSIIINEMLPKLRRDPSYLDRMGYQLEYKGQDVSSSSFNWNTIGSTKAFSVRQPPGDDNALGELKILFPNKHAIYLHDTPSKSLFNKVVRDFSHGCVRMQDPRGMAAAVLGISREKVADYIATGQNQGVAVPQKIPVFAAYFTAWPNAEGKVEYFRDIYDRDTYLNRALASTEAERHAAGVVASR